jgi:uroporphyrinogen decarboxylase
MRGTQLSRDVHFENFLKAVTRKGRPSYLPFYEHIASSGFIAERMGGAPGKSAALDERMRYYVDFWLGMGYDNVPIEVPLSLKLGEGAQALSHGSEAHAVIRNREDFERYPWPDEANPVDFAPYEVAAKMLPAGIKLVAGPAMGPFEWVSQMLGMMGLSYMLADDPDLVEMMFKRVGALGVSAVTQLAKMDFVGALRQGDDLGFKTSTFLSPSQLRAWVFPVYKAMAAAAHAEGKPFILHSCGNLSAVYEDLIEDCRIDAKHSFEDTILPVSDFKRLYGARITPLGGLDVDRICRSDEKELRRYAREMIEKCFADGHWAMGTGNSLTDYMPVGNYLTVLEEGMSG